MCSKIKSWLKSAPRYRYHAIPCLIGIVFALSICLSYERAPEHYQKEKAFHLSSLGNWQEGLSFFSVGLVVIAGLMNILTSEMLRQRIIKTGYCAETVNCNGTVNSTTANEHANDTANESTSVLTVQRDTEREISPESNEANETAVRLLDEESGISRESMCCCRRILCTISCNWPCLLWIGSFVMYFGLVITGCFQQSFNKPWHTIGVFLMGFGFLLIFVQDQSCAWCSKMNESYKRGTSGCLAWFFQTLLFSVSVVSLIVFTACHFISKSEWDAGKEEELRRLHKNGNITEEKCPGKSINDWLKRQKYPLFYPCKSKSLWSEGDPGYKYYWYSGIAEIIMFTAVVLYTFTYCCLLDRECVKACGDCAPKQLKQLFPEPANRTENLQTPANGSGNQQTGV